jgi:hypothetical protein
VTLPSAEVQLRGLVGGRINVLYRAKPPASPPDDPASIYRTIVRQELAVSATPTRVILIRTVIYHRHPKCRDGPVKCGIPERYEPWSAQLLAGGLRSPFRVVTAADRAKDRCAALPDAVAAWRATAVYAAEPAPNCRPAGRAGALIRVSLVGAPRPSVLVRTADARVAGLAYAGRYVAWSETREGTCPCTRVLVRDVRKRGQRLVAAGDRTAHDLQLQPDGALVLVDDVVRKFAGTCGRDEVGYVVPGARRARFLGRPVYQLGGFARNRVVYVGAPPSTCSGSTLQLYLQELGGRARVLRELGRTSLTGIDYDGRLLATATAVGLEDTVVRIERR